MKGDIHMEAFVLRPFQDEDAALFRGWVKRPHVAKWYWDPEDWFRELEERHGAFSWLRHFIITWGGREIGFCQYYPYAESGEDWHGGVPLEGTYSIDYLIGEPEYLGKGLGRETIRRLVDLVREEPGAARIIVMPDAENAASCNALLSAGFHYDGENRLYRLEL